MTQNSPDSDFDFAGFLLIGNTLVKLIEKDVIDMRDAKDIIHRTQNAYKDLQRRSYRCRCQ